MISVSDAFNSVDEEFTGLAGRNLKLALINFNFNFNFLVMMTQGLLICS